MYAERVEKEEVEPPNHVIAAMSRLNDLQQEYEYPSRDMLKEAKDNDEVTRFKTLKN